MSGLLNKAKQAVHEATAPKHEKTTTHTTHTTTATSGLPEGTVGPHSSRVANAADPRVDSDLDNRAHHGTGVHSTTTTTGAGFGTTGTSGSTNAGPHNSNLLNKVDPRVDSDLDHSRNAGLNQTTHTGHTATGPGIASNTHGSTNAGPHNSNLLNKIDPRVDSDLDRSRNAGLNQTTHTTGHTTTSGVGGVGGVGGTTYGSTNAGPHNSNALNKVDPRVDSDLDGSRNAGLNQTTHNGGHTSTTGPGVGGVGGTTHGSTNAGPHNSNLLNKLDPRVDSDLDGSRNAGMNQTTRPTY